MNEQEYRLIRNLAWDVLIDSKTARLPINLAAIASLYKLNSPEEKLSFYVKAFQISSAILQTFGLYGNEKIEYFTVRILAPITVLNALNITSPPCGGCSFYRTSDEFSDPTVQQVINSPETRNNWHDQTGKSCLGTIPALDFSQLQKTIMLSFTTR